MEGGRDFPQRTGATRVVGRAGGLRLLDKRLKRVGDLRCAFLQKTENIYKLSVGTI